MRPTATTNYCQLHALIPVRVLTNCFTHSLTLEQRSTSPPAHIPLSLHPHASSRTTFLHFTSFFCLLAPFVPSRTSSLLLTQDGYDTATTVEGYDEAQPLNSCLHDNTTAIHSHVCSSPCVCCCVQRVCAVVSMTAARAVCRAAVRASSTVSMSRSWTAARVPPTAASTTCVCKSAAAASSTPASEQHYGLATV